MTSTDSIDPANREEHVAGLPALTVIAGLSYWEQSQVFKRWLLRVYQTSFLWTGNRCDAEDATAWVFNQVAARTRLPEPVSAVDDRVAGATLEAARRHWSDRYGVDHVRCVEIQARETLLSDRPAMTLADLCDGLSVEMRLVIVLRFLRKHPLPAIAAQLGVPPRTANDLQMTALLAVARQIGLDAPALAVQADQVAAFVDDLVGKRRPVRFEVLPGAWAALLAATHVLASVAGNNLPRIRFVRSLEETLKQGPVTHLRIWSA